MLNASSFLSILVETASCFSKIVLCLWCNNIFYCHISYYLLTEMKFYLFLSFIQCYDASIFFDALVLKNATQIRSYCRLLLCIHPSMIKVQVNRHLPLRLSSEDSVRLYWPSGFLATRVKFPSHWARLQADHFWFSLAFVQFLKKYIYIKLQLWTC